MLGSTLPGSRVRESHVTSRGNRGHGLDGSSSARHPWGQNQRWLLVCLKVCVICFHKALTVFSRELRAISFKTASCIHTAIRDICLACAIQIKPTNTVQAHSESEVQSERKKKGGPLFVRLKEYYSGSSLLRPNKKSLFISCNLHLSKIRMSV